MADQYNAVEITDEEKASLSVEEQTTESDNQPVNGKTETEEPSQEVSETVEVEDEFTGLEIDGERYDLDTINAWREDSDNKDNWQKSNTEKSQELAQWNKLSEKLQDPEFREYIKDFFYDNPDEANKLGLDSLQALGIQEDEPQEEESTGKMYELEDRLNSIEEDKMVVELGHELDQLVSLNKELIPDDDTELEFLSFVEDNQIASLELGFKLWSHDKIVDQLDHLKKLDENKSRNTGKVISKSQKGAAEEQSNKALKDWNDVNMKNPEVAKFFNH